MDFVCRAAGFLAGSDRNYFIKKRHYNVTDVQFTDENNAGGTTNALVTRSVSI
mgnify:CR=1 FL=1